MMTALTEETFSQEVLASSVPVLVHFQAPWCGLCRLIKPTLNQLKDEWPVPIRLLDINADENLRLANYYQLKTLPTLLYIEGGKILHRIEGIDSRDGFRDRLACIASRYKLETTYSSLSADVGELPTIRREL